MAKVIGIPAKKATVQRVGRNISEKKYGSIVLASLKSVNPAPQNPRSRYSFNDAIVTQIFSLDNIEKCPHRYLIREVIAGEKPPKDYNGWEKISVKEVTAIEWRDIKRKGLEYLKNNIQKLGLKTVEYGEISGTLNKLVSEQMSQEISLAKQKRDFSKLVTLASSIFKNDLIEAIEVSDVENNQYEVVFGTRRRLSKLLLLEDDIQVIPARTDRKLSDNPVDVFLRKWDENEEQQKQSLAELIDGVETFKLLKLQQDPKFKITAAVIEQNFNSLSGKKAKLLHKVSSNTAEAGLVRDLIYQERITDYTMLGSNFAELIERSQNSQGLLARNRVTNKNKSTDIKKENGKAKQINFKITNRLLARKIAETIANELNVEIELGDIDDRELQKYINKMLKGQ